MESRSRTENSIRNAATAMTARILSIVFGYVARIVLTRTLNVNLVGINGLFTNILGAMSLSEMGIDVALVYALYAPISERNYEKQNSLLALYQKIYLVIAGIVILIGVAMYPLLKILMTEDPSRIPALPLIYALFIANSAATYLCAARALVFLADQKNYLNDLFYSVFLMLQYVLQIILLLATGDFLLFLLVQIVCNVMKNICVSRYAGKRYPWLREKKPAALPAEERRSIRKNTGAMLIHKIGKVIIGNTDNLCLTFFSGLTAVARYANYYLIIGSVRQIADNIVRSIAGSVGNLAAEETPDKVLDVFSLTLFAVNWLYGFSAITLLCVLTPFIRLSFGSEYVFSLAINAVLCLNFYLNGIRQATLVFRDSLGLFWYDRYKTVAESLINLVTSIILALKIGTIGVFIGTTISIVSVSMWIEPMILCHRYFEMPLSAYLKKLAGYLSVTALAAAVSWFTCRDADALLSRAAGNGLWSTFLLNLLICLLVPNLIYVLFYHRKRQFRQLVSALAGYKKKLFSHHSGK